MKSDEFFSSRKSFIDKNDQIQTITVTKKKKARIFYIKEFLQMAQELEMTGYSMLSLDYNPSTLDPNPAHSKIAFDRMINHGKYFSLVFALN